MDRDVIMDNVGSGRDAKGDRQGWINMRKIGPRTYPPDIQAGVGNMARPERLSNQFGILARHECTVACGLLMPHSRAENALANRRSKPILYEAT